MKKQYIHYGSDIYLPELVSQVHDACLTKPNKGLWASPVNSSWSWKAWCEAEEWHASDFSKFFKFTLSESARILEIHKEADIENYVKINNQPFPVLQDELNREKVYKEFDGIELFLSEDFTMHNGFFNLWDCDSIVAWNPDVIVVEPKSL